MVLSEKNVKRCHTATAWTVYKGKVLLVKHKKLGIWLAPGGHVEDNELPHKAAEREFFEETGVRAVAISAFPLEIESKDSEYLPLPFYCNLHEINKPRGNSFCEQHYAWGFYVRVEDASGFHDQDEGITGIDWYAPAEIDALETTQGIKDEAAYVFSHFPDTL